MTTLTEYWMEKNAFEKKSSPILRGTFKGVENLFKSAPKASLTPLKKQDWGGYFKAQFDPRAVKENVVESFKNPGGSVLHQLGLRSKSSESFLKELGKSDLPHLRDYASDSLSDLKTWGEMGLFDKSFLVGAPAFTYMGVKGPLEDYNKGRIGIGEFGGSLGREALFAMGGPGFQGALMGISGIPVAAGRKIDQIIDMPTARSRQTRHNPMGTSRGYVRRSLLE